MIRINEKVGNEYQIFRWDLIQHLDYRHHEITWHEAQHFISISNWGCKISRLKLPKVAAATFIKYIQCSILYKEEATRRYLLYKHRTKSFEILWSFHVSESEIKSFDERAQKEMSRIKDNLINVFLSYTFRLQFSIHVRYSFFNIIYFMYSYSLGESI